MGVCENRDFVVKLEDMNKTLYSWLIFFLGLSGVSALLQSIIHFLLGQQIFMLDSFDSWFVIINITAFIGSMLLLKYYSSQRYWFVLATGVLYYVCSFFHALVFYTILHFQKLANYNTPLLFVSIAAGILYAVSLMSLRAKSARWLKLAGVFMFIIGLVFLFTLIGRVTHISFATGNTIDRVSQWTTFASCLVPILFILHFIKEFRKSTGAPARKALQNWVGFAGFTGGLLTLVFGVILSSECHSSLYWADQGYKHTLALAQMCDPGIFTNSKGDTLRYRLLKPPDYDPAKKYPIVISLPYGGQPGTDTIRQIEGAVAAELLTKDDNRRRYPAFIFIPNCPPGAGWGGIPHYPEVDSLVFDAIIALDRQFSIDENRRYVTGLSRGGFGTWNFICKRPDMFAAAVPVAGGGDPSLAPRIVHMAIWAFHGEKDKNVPVASSRNMIDAIKRAGGTPRYTEYPDEGHNIWDKVSKTPGLLDWIFAQRRE